LNSAIYLALALNPNFIYLKIKDLKKNDTYVVAECRIAEFYKDPKTYEVIEKIKGSDL
jgi:isoleucyl-tRNA synthetase